MRWSQTPTSSRRRCSLRSHNTQRATQIRSKLATCIGNYFLILVRADWRGGGGVSLASFHSFCLATISSGSTRWWPLSCGTFSRLFFSYRAVCLNSRVLYLSSFLANSTVYEPKAWNLRSVTWALYPSFAPSDRPATVPFGRAVLDLRLPKGQSTLYSSYGSGRVKFGPFGHRDAWLVEKWSIGCVYSKLSDTRDAFSFPARSASSG